MKLVLQASLGTLLAAALMFALDMMSDGESTYWDEFQTDKSSLSYFCEETNLQSLFRHKVNTYTNLGYLWAALWIGFNARQDKRKGGQTFLRRHTEWSWLFARTCFLVFLGSTLFHAGLVDWTEWADLLGVYAVTLCIASITVHRLAGLFTRRRTSPQPYIIMWLVLWLLACYSIFSIKSWYIVISATILIALGGSLISLMTQRNGAVWWFIGSMACTSLAVMFFVFDISRIGCDPKSWIQPHGLWHLFAAGSFILHYRFFRSSTAQHAAL